MNRDLRLYVEDIWESIAAIEEYTRGVSKAEFEDDRQLQDAVARRLETIGETVKHLPDDFRLRYPEVPWKQIAGLRDVLIHEYFNVRIMRVWYVVASNLQALKQAIARPDFTGQLTYARGRAASLRPPDQRTAKLSSRQTGVSAPRLASEARGGGYHAATGAFQAGGAMTPA